jgi:hypothetical protein
MSWMTVYNWPVFRCPQLAGFGCPPRLEGTGAIHLFLDRTPIGGFNGIPTLRRLAQYRPCPNQKGPDNPTTRKRISNASPFQINLRP